MNNGNVLQTDAAQAHVIQAWLDSNDMAGAKDFRGGADARALVNLQAKPVAGPMEESLHPSANDTGPVTFADKKLLNSAVHVLAIHAVAQFLKGEFLCISDNGVEFLDRVAGAAAHHRARDVPPIPRSHIPGKMSRMIVVCARSGP